MKCNWHNWKKPRQIFLCWPHKRFINQTRLKRGSSDVGLMQRFFYNKQLIMLMMVSYMMKFTQRAKPFLLVLVKNALLLKSFFIKLSSTSLFAVNPIPMFVKLLLKILQFEKVISFTFSWKLHSETKALFLPWKENLDTKVH